MAKRKGSRGGRIIFTLLLIAALCGAGFSGYMLFSELSEYSSGKAAWGGEDPIWYGFTQFTGNCYVHAVCLEALLEYYGYTYQEIWVTHIDDGRPPHYWVIVDMGGYWRHVDATPGVAHSKYSLMTDEQRYETLYRSDYGQRDWDRSLWPACE